MCPTSIASRSPRLPANGAACENGRTLGQYSLTIQSTRPTPSQRHVPCCRSRTSTSSSATRWRTAWTRRSSGRRRLSATCGTASCTATSTRCGGTGNTGSSGGWAVGQGERCGQNRQYKRLTNLAAQALCRCDGARGEWAVSLPPGSMVKNGNDHSCRALCCIQVVVPVTHLSHWRKPNAEEICAYHRANGDVALDPTQVRSTDHAK